MDEIAAFSQAAENYIMDPSSGNCNAYKSSLQNFLNALKSLEDCADEVGQGDEFRESIEQAEDSISTLTC